ncbi:hypothetical protein EVAR_98362_1 [Eumeta japonica]|uniref:Uncharacterized protein n=1 Tax=Eumeta variegata TaxID=151549 RepID=A0A4C2A4S4_EUMVA|nr:hypothetical protein EVAR_98362_1 [Eumeta japonica]
MISERAAKCWSNGRARRLDTGLRRLFTHEERVPDPARVWSSRRTIKGYVRSAAARGSDAANAIVERIIRRRSREDDLEIARYNDVLVTSPQQRRCFPRFS